MKANEIYNNYRNQPHFPTNPTYNNNNKYINLPPSKYCTFCKRTNHNTNDWFTKQKQVIRVCQLCNT